MATSCAFYGKFFGPSMFFFWASASNIIFTHFFRALLEEGNNNEGKNNEGNGNDSTNNDGNGNQGNDNEGNNNEGNKKDEDNENKGF